MHCANSQCARLAQHLFEGTLWFVELELPPGARISGDGNGFPVCIVPSRYFWLCSDCSRSMKIHKWTRAGIVFWPSGHAKKLVASHSDNSAHFSSNGGRSRESESLIRPA